jgi:hypothetical protein
MADLKYVTYCGLYCRHCVNFARIPQQAKALYDTMKREGYEYFGPHASPEFNNFWKQLGKLTTLDKDNRDAEMMVAEIRTVRSGYVLAKGTRISACTVRNIPAEILSSLSGSTQL